MANRKAESRAIREQNRTPAFSGAAGGRVATDVGARDEKRAIEDGDDGKTRVTKGDEVTGRIPTRADHEGAAR